MARYTLEQMAAAVARSNEAGPYAAAADYGVNPRTVISWVKATNPPQCEAHVFGGYRTHPCTHPGIKERDGHPVCHQHAQPNVYVEWEPFSVAGELPATGRAWWEGIDQAPGPKVCVQCGAALPPFSAGKLCDWNCRRAWSRARQKERRLADAA